MTRLIRVPVLIVRNASSYYALDFIIVAAFQKAIVIIAQKNLQSKGNREEFGTLRKSLKFIETIGLENYILEQL